MKHKIIYLSGQISGLTGTEAYSFFQMAAKMFNSNENIVINPLQYIEIEERLAKRNLSYKEIMEKDLALVEICDEIVMLPNWQKSLGATEEHKLAKELNKHIIYL